MVTIPMQLGKYGASKVLQVSNDQLQIFNASAYADTIAQAAKSEASQVIIISSSANSKYLAPLLAVNMEAGFVSKCDGITNKYFTF